MRFHITRLISGRVSRRLTATVASLGLVLSLVAASGAGGDQPPAQANDLRPLDIEAARTSLFAQPAALTEEIPIVLGAARGEATDLAALDATIDFWTQRAERDPRDFVALNQLGGLYLRRARLAALPADLLRARDAFAQSVESNRSRNVGGLIGLAHSEVYTHHFTEGHTLALEAIDLKPNAAYPRWVLGDALLGLGQYDAAYKAFAHPAALNGTLPAHARLAHIEGLRGNLEAAELQWQLAIAADTGRLPEDTVWLHIQLGVFYMDAGRTDDAATQFQGAFDLKPADAAALDGLAAVATARGQLDEAIRIAEFLTDTQPSIESATLLADLYAATGQPDRAQLNLDLAFALERAQRAAGIATDLDRAVLLVAAGDPASVAAAELAYEARPGIEAADTLAWAYYQAGELPLAQLFSQDALRHGTRHPDLLAHAGLIEFALGNQEAARELLGAVQAINPRYSASEAPLVRAALDRLGETAAPGG